MAHRLIGKLGLMVAIFFLLQLGPGIIVGQANEIIDKPLILKPGMAREEVLELQLRLKRLGLLTTSVTGYYGALTTQAVKDFQTLNGLQADGVAGQKTLKRISNNAADSREKSLQTVSHRSGIRIGFLVPWFGKGEKIFPRGANAYVTDVDTGLTFAVRRTQGFNHADCETLTSKDTAIMKSIYGGKWSWNRRAIVVNVGGRRIAASMAGMPHGGEYINNNEMNGHFDIHFYGSKTHCSNSINSWHQAMVQKAAGYN